MRFNCPSTKGGFAIDRHHIPVLILHDVVNSKPYMLYNFSIWRLPQKWQSLVKLGIIYGFGANPPAISTLQRRWGNHPEMDDFPATSSHVWLPEATWSKVIPHSTRVLIVGCRNSPLSTDFGLLVATSSIQLLVGNQHLISSIDKLNHNIKTYLATGFQKISISTCSHSAISTSSQFDGHLKTWNMLEQDETTNNGSDIWKYI